MRLYSFTMLSVIAAVANVAAAQTLDHGAVVRGDTANKRIALVFTGGDYGESTGTILDKLRKYHIRAGLFVTGAYIRNAGHSALLRRAIREGHYVGPHSDQHLLYAPWDDREHSLVSEAAFKADLKKNIQDLNELGAKLKDPVLFIPPYEWFNRDQVRWASEMNVQLFNFSPGSGSNRDYMPESDPHFVPSRKILDDILAFERRDPHGLNGFILLLHLGADRRDKFAPMLDELIIQLRSRGYEFVRIDEMLGK